LLTLFPGEEMHDEETRARIQAYLHSLSPEQLRLIPFYHDIRNEIIEPRKFVQETKYFWRRWKSLLGPLNTVLIMEMRDRCYYNPRTGEKRAYCYPSLDNLARSIGVSKATIKRALADEKVKPFVRSEPNYRVDPKMNKKIRSSNTYHIAMDDPLLPEDEERLMEKLFQRLCKEGPAPIILNAPDKTIPAPRPKSPGAHFEPQVHPSRVQIEPHIYEAQNELISNTVKSTLNNENVSEASSTDANEQEAKVNLLVQDMLDVLQDPESRNFYRLVARRVLEAEGNPELIYRALSETKVAARSGKIKKTKGACFTFHIKEYCKERGISLTAR